MVKGVAYGTKDIINRHPAKIGMGGRKREWHNTVAVNGGGIQAYMPTDVREWCFAYSSLLLMCWVSQRGRGAPCF